MTAQPDARAAPTLHLLCGKIAAGKSTLARSLAAAPATLLLSEDDWLARLYPGEIATAQDYVRCAGRLRGVVVDHAAALLQAGLSVVLDFPANTVELRRELRRSFETAGAAHRLHYIDLPDDLCRARLRARNAAGTHAFQASDADYDRFTRHFQPPQESEGFVIERHDGA